MYRIRQQHGMSPLTVLFTIVIFGVGIFVGFKLAPVYLEHFSVMSSLKSFEKEVGVRTKSKAELMRILTRRLEINDVKRVQANDITIKKRPQGTTIRIAYEVAIPMVSNIDFLVTFDDAVTLN